MEMTDFGHLVQGTSLNMGTSVACQTEDYLPNHVDEEPGCNVTGCFCKENMKDWSWLVRGGVFLFLVFLLFTFGCGLELEMQQYQPITWHLLRSVFVQHSFVQCEEKLSFRALAMDVFGVPEPFVLIAYNPMN